MVGLRFRINELPEEPDEPRILMHKLFLPAGILFLFFGLWAAWGYFHTGAPAVRELQELRLQDVIAATPIHQGRTGEVSSVSLRFPGERRVEYKRLWPRYEQVQGLDTNLSLLVDQTNQIWALRLVSGQIAEQAYFSSRNLEMKGLLGFCALFCLPSALIGFAAFFEAERALRKGALPKDMRVLIRTRKLVLVAALFGYLFFYGLVLVPLLGKALPIWALGLIWVISGGLLGNLLVARLKKWRVKPRQSS
jgi:hypothetical protein